MVCGYIRVYNGVYIYKVIKYTYIYICIGMIFCSEHLKFKLK